MTKAHRRLVNPFLILFLLIFGFPTQAEDTKEAEAAHSLERYERAQYFLNAKQSKVYEAYITANWIDDGETFWYEKDGVKAKEYFLVIPNKKLKKPLFDRQKLALALQKSTEEKIDSDHLPITIKKYDHQAQSLEFSYLEKSFVYYLNEGVLNDAPDTFLPSPTESLSPDGNWVAYVKEYNLFVRNVDSDEETQLTFDGLKHFAYGTNTESSLYHISQTRGQWPIPPVLAWSPDSSKILTHQLDERKVVSTHLLQMTDVGKSLRPIIHTYKYPVPSDTNVPLAYPIVIDVKEKVITKLDVPPFISTTVTPLDKVETRLWWDEASQSIEALWQPRCLKEIKYYQINPNNGNARLMITESSDSLVAVNAFLFSKPNVRRLSSGEFIWFSERSGYGHLYLYDHNKALKNAITKGDYVVRDVLYLDEGKRQIYFTASGKEKGRDPYFINFYSVNFDGSNLTLLTPENADHKIKLSPNNKFFISNNAWSGEPVSILRDISGKFIMNLEVSDFSAWTNKGWQWPERVEMKAADEHTKTYGLVFKPTHLDSEKRYPVIDDIYPGPQMTRAEIGYDWPVNGGLRHQSALAELGFIVINMDGRGTPLRSKAFLLHAYNNLGFAGGLVDHVSGIKQLAASRSYLDIDRVGIFGHSAGGYASARAILKFPDFYDVAVSSAGNHDSEGNISIWMDTYMCSEGLNENKAHSNIILAENLKGKLLLMTGDMDDNVHPSQTINLVDALIKANKDFDFILIPNANHSSSRHPYFMRKRWDYFYKHLLGKTPPKNFELKTN
ncbi:DPP IV N-terminal domain-containing protein [Paraglaciecola sp. 2405UD69-4]|uniref:S9 family peptidase n=1 Tax=Paraglaciecola sp. 2405UD69-4 TaxID=3391836 RepID=UPI0039C9E40A